MDDLNSIVIEVSVPESKNLSIDQIRQMIKACETTEDGENLRNAMNELKAALKVNAAACAMMAPEDVGQCTHYLRKLTGKLILADIHGDAKKGKKADKVQISQDDLDNLSAEDLM